MSDTRFDRAWSLFKTAANAAEALGFLSTQETAHVIDAISDELEIIEDEAAEDDSALEVTEAQIPPVQS
jgi:hypothetical protein